MRKILVPIALSMMLAGSGLAFAATLSSAPAAAPAVNAMSASQSITSTVKAFDLHAHTLTLANGIAYQLPATFKDPGLKAGEKVTVQWRMNGSAYDAQSVALG